MQLQFSIFGYIIIFFIYAVAFIFLAWISRRLGPNPRKWVLIVPLGVAAFLLPIVDEILITWRFSHLCENAGVQVARKVEVKGFYDATMPSGYEFIRHFGYQFMEHPSEEKGKVDRIEKAKDGSWKKTTLDQPTARYHYKRMVDFRDERGIHYEQKVAHSIYVTGQIVFDSEANEIIAKNVQYHRYPGWVERLWISFFGSGLTICPNPESENQQPFPMSVLLPLGQ